MDQDLSAFINVTFNEASRKANEGALLMISSLSGVSSAHFFGDSKAEVFSDGSRRIEELVKDIEELQGVKEAFAPVMHM